MKKRILSAMASLLLVCTVVCSSIVNVSAEDTGTIFVDGSYLTTEESSTGTTYNPLLRGQYLMDGISTISKAGVKKVSIYGSTTANTTVDYVAIIVYVEEYNEEDGTWEQIDFWTVEAENNYYVATQKTVYVDGGHYYRARCEHFAGMEGDALYDGSVSVTNGIWVN